MNTTETRILDAVSILAFVLTNRPLRNKGAGWERIDELVNGEEFYLPDGGYSRIVVSLETGKARLTSTSTDRVKLRWQTPYARKLTFNLEVAVRIRRQEIDPTYLPEGQPVMMIAGATKPLEQALKTTTIKTVNVNACPHRIMLPSHYRDDGSCKCSDPGERAMMIAEWGYTADDFTDIPLQGPVTGMSYKAEVIADSSGKWVSNMLRFATDLEAVDYVKDLEFRWVSVRKTRVLPCGDPVNARWLDGRVEHIRTQE